MADSIYAEYHILQSRAAGSITSVPVIGPFLTPLVPVLESVGLAGGAASASPVHEGALTPQQVSALANVESILSEAVYNLTSSGAPGSTSVSNSTAAAKGSQEQSFHTEELMDIGSILLNLSVVGPFLQPLIPLLDSIGLGSSSVAPAAAAEAMTSEQSAVLAKLLIHLTDSVRGLNMTRILDHAAAY
jgi:hypothetical protein